jgi:hypothetical protein
MPEETIGSAEHLMCPCRVCAKKRGQGVVPSGTIHEYSAQPRGGWTVRRTTAEQGAFTTAPTFGVELETVVAERRRTADPTYTGPERPSAHQFGGYDDPAYLEAQAAYNAAVRAHHERISAQRAREEREWEAAGNLSADEAAGVAAPRGLWLPCHDGSVSGPEFKSQPATLAYWRSQRDALARMFRELLHGGIRSHDGDRAGLHINIGVDGFADASHIERFAALVVANPRWATRMAQRTHSSASHWSPFRGPVMNAADRADWARQCFSRRGAYQDRYSVLNGSNAGRIEFRLPRGTLRVDRFMAKIEWAASMIEYTRDADHPVNVGSYVGWLAANAADWPEVTAYMQERFPKRFDAAAA